MKVLYYLIEILSFKSIKIYFLYVNLNKNLKIYIAIRKTYATINKNRRNLWELYGQ